MLNEERKRLIYELVDKKGSVSVSELIKELAASESTIRRALIEMDREGLIKKVHGGAVSLKKEVLTKDQSVSQREDENIEEKQLIAKYAAELIKDGDVCYIDAGTSTYLMIPYLNDKKATFVTNGLKHGLALANQGHQVYMPGGSIKRATEAIIGAKAADFLTDMHFTIGFFGTNGITLAEGYTTPDVEEGMIKKKAFGHCQECYILADSSKFNKVCTASFGQYSDAIIITTSKARSEYANSSNTLLVDRV